jgi:antitoxin CptB
VKTHQSDPANRARLRWRARRGLLENDLILTRFLDAHEETMTDEDVDALTRLLDLADNPLMDLLLGRSRARRRGRPAAGARLAGAAAGSVKRTGFVFIL